MLVPLDDLLPEILPFIPNVADPLAFRYLREAARDLCQRGLMWRENDTIEVTTPDFVGICTITDAAIVRIESATLEEQTLEPKAVAWLDRNLPRWRTEEASPAKYVTQIAPNSVTIVPKVSGTLEIALVLQPSKKAEMVPDWLVEQYGTQIGKGAAGRIMLIPDSATSNPQLGAAHVTEFEQLLDNLATAAAKTQLGAALRTKGSYF
jgi:hypothetical protein